MQAPIYGFCANILGYHTDNHDPERIVQLDSVAVLYKTLTGTHAEG